MIGLLAHPLPPSPGSKLGRRHTERLRKRDKLSLVDGCHAGFFLPCCRETVDLCLRKRIVSWCVFFNYIIPILPFRALCWNSSPKVSKCPKINLLWRMTQGCLRVLFCSIRNLCWVPWDQRSGSATQRSLRSGILYPVPPYLAPLQLYKKVSTVQATFCKWPSGTEIIRE